MTVVRPLLQARMARAAGQRAGGACFSQQPKRSTVPLTASQPSRARYGAAETALSSLVNANERTSGATISIDP